jgi:hypothetical protein
VLLKRNGIHVNHVGQKPIENLLAKIWQLMQHLNSKNVEMNQLNTIGNYGKIPVKTCEIDFEKINLYFFSQSDGKN